MEKEVNILKHRLVPKHIKLTEEEKQQILKKYNVSEQQLPSILISDPAIKSLEPKIGDLIKIVRDSPTKKESIFFRVVVNG